MRAFFIYLNDYLYLCNTKISIVNASVLEALFLS